MQIEYKSDYPVNDAACRIGTGRSLKEWFEALDAKGESQKRRDSVNWLNGEMKQKDGWWSTTVWVEYERARNIVNRKDGLIEGYNICVTKTINALLDDVYSAFVEPAQFGNWFGSKNNSIVEEGKSFQDIDGNSGQYLRVRANKDLRFSWMGSNSDAPTQVDVAFADKGKGKTGVTLTHNRIQSRAEADGLRAAWGLAFDRLKSQLEIQE